MKFVRVVPIRVDDTEIYINPDHIVAVYVREGVVRLELSTSTEYDTAFEIVDDFEDFKAAAALAGLELP